MGLTAAVAAETWGETMQTRIQELPRPALAGGLMVLGGVAVWQLGIELERAWLRSYEQPLLGETLAGELKAVGEQLDDGSEHRREVPATASGEQRRWVAPQQPRLAPRLRTT